MYRVLLKNNETGEERWYETGLEWEEHHDFLWTEGNFACDCNRFLAFQRAVGREPTEDVPCGDSKFTAVCALLPNGRRIPLDAIAET